MAEQNGTRRPLSRSQQYRRKKKAAALGISTDELPDCRGKHANHARGKNHPRWNQGRIICSEGYAKVRVGTTHPLADPNGYAYEHLMVWLTAGNPKPVPGEVIHHKDEDRTNNRLENLEHKTSSAHAKDHDMARGRDALGRFPSGKKGI